jgi:hypothetical protein
VLPPTRRPLIAHRDLSQIELPLLASPAAFRRRLAAAGLGEEWRVTITDNRQTMVSFRDHAVRVHRVYLDAPDYVVEAIARFVLGRRRDVRRAASRIIVAYGPAQEASSVVPIRRAEQTHPRDEPWANRLTALHRQLNFDAFDNGLREIPIRVSRRMRRKLGHYTVAAEGCPPEIAISRWHIRHHPWPEVVHTLLHEMVHQWQDEQGLPIAHDKAFRQKARAVGADPRATRNDDLDQVLGARY